MTFAQRRNRLTTHFSEGIPVVKRRMTVFCHILPLQLQIQDVFYFQDKRSRFPIHSL